MSMGKMSWEPEQWAPARRSWWMKVMETDWVYDRDIQHTCGPEYLMYEDMKEFGAESAYRGFPKNR